MPIANTETNEQTSNASDSPELFFYRLVLQAFRSLALWQEERKSNTWKVLLSGFEGSGKTTFINAVQKMSKTENYIDLTDELISGTSFPFEVYLPSKSTSLVFYERRFPTKWNPVYKHGAVDMLLYMVDSVKVNDKDYRDEVYKHFHGILGHCYKKYTCVFLLATRAEDPDCMSLDDIAAFLRLSHLQTCGWYMACFEDSAEINLTDNEMVETTIDQLLQHVTITTHRRSNMLFYFVCTERPQEWYATKERTFHYSAWKNWVFTGMHSIKTRQIMYAYNNRHAKKIAIDKIREIMDQHMAAIGYEAAVKGESCNNIPDPSFSSYSVDWDRVLGCPSETSVTTSK
eukprot:CAMPEP_0174255400 /NCGR_PEP_ID=MMETSP0439-20130205/4749_1 /TAXON_ID=0 /ORGANISM="Stereomyxa ramosa, Strain Chinc5" /LENGTH=343 /DNA_ID=CAMNT_0015337579 /DNA_START=396 /DNA_END=1427 /DNA_ORIENTATION=+